MASLRQGLVLRETADGCLVPIKAVPRASRDQLAGTENGELKVKVRSPPVEGAANEALLGYLAGILDLAPSRLRVVRGQKSRHKTVEVRGLKAEDLYRLLEKNHIDRH